MSMPSISDVVTKASAKCAEARQLVRESNALLDGSASGNGINFQQKHRDLIIERAFMDVFEALESFLESIFICYMTGQVGLNGTSVVRYVTPIDSEHAEKILCGKEQYVDFTNRQAIMKFAENFFQNGGPFSYLSSISQDFEDMKKIRNEISHKSLKSRREFEGLVRSKTATMPPSITVTMFLLTVMPRSRISFFTHYVDVVDGIINALANP